MEYSQLSYSQMLTSVLSRGDLLRVACRVDLGEGAKREDYLVCNMLLNSYLICLWRGGLVLNAKIVSEQRIFLFALGKSSDEELHSNCFAESTVNGVNAWGAREKAVLGKFCLLSEQ